MGDPTTFIEDLFSGFVPGETVRQKARQVFQSQKKSVRTLKSRVENLEDRLGELTLLNHTMVRLLLQKKVFSWAELLAVIKEVDLLDGVEDGKLSKKPAEKKKKSSPKGSRSKRKR
ncbi:MAG: hypothetical protein ACYTHM_00085 [Planctomycetota bacterium]|jgi:hypothetical protein